MSDWISYSTTTIDYIVAFLLEEPIFRIVCCVIVAGIFDVVGDLIK